MPATKEARQTWLPATREAYHTQAYEFFGLNPTETKIVPTFTPVPPNDQGYIGEEELFFEDFEDNNFQVLLKEGNWHIVDDGTGNRVYEVTGNNPNNWPFVFFGSNFFDNYYVEYRFKIIDFDENKTPAIVTYLRNYNYTHYSIELILSTGKGKISWEEWGSNDKKDILTNYHLTIYEGMWYQLKTTISDFEISFYIDDQLISQVPETRMINNSNIQLINGSPGLGVGNGNQIWFDDIRVVSINN